MRFPILVASFLLLTPASAWAQDEEAAIRRIDIEMIGLSVDVDDGKRLGRDCRWRTQRSAGDDGCTVTYATIEALGFDVSRGESVSMIAGEFGPARFRMSGRITSLNFLERERRIRIWWVIGHGPCSSMRRFLPTFHPSPCRKSVWRCRKIRPTDPGSRASETAGSLAVFHCFAMLNSGQFI